MVFDIDVVYVIRPQVERWTIKELEMYSDSLPSAKEELEKRRKLDIGIDIVNAN